MPRRLRPILLLLAALIGFAAPWAAPAVSAVSTRTTDITNTTDTTNTPNTTTADVDVEPTAGREGTPSDTVTDREIRGVAGVARFDRRQEDHSFRDDHGSDRLGVTLPVRNLPATGIATPECDDDPLTDGPCAATRGRAPPATTCHSN